MSDYANKAIVPNLFRGGRESSRHMADVGLPNDLWKGLKLWRKGAPKAEQAIAENEAYAAKGAPWMI